MRRARSAPRQDHGFAAGVEPLDEVGAVREHGALVDGALVGDLALVDRWRLLEHERTRDARGASGARRPQTVDEVLEEMLHLRRTEHFLRTGMRGQPRERAAGVEAREQQDADLVAV